MFLIYGLSNSSASPFHFDSGLGSLSHGSTSRETVKKAVGAYRPPHLRRGKIANSARSRISQASSDHESSPVEFSSSDSDYSDSDGSLKDSDNLRSCKVRTAAITCIQVKIEKNFTLSNFYFYKSCFTCWKLLVVQFCCKYLWLIIWSYLLLFEKINSMRMQLRLAL